MRVIDILANPDESLRRLFPSLNLAHVYENNEWHIQQSVLDHTLQVLKAVEKFSDPINSICGLQNMEAEALSRYLSQHINGNENRISLLKLSALFHDIGKSSTMLIQPNGTTSCPGHAEESCLLFNKVRKIIELTNKEADYVESLIQAHHKADAPMGDLSPKQISRGGRQLQAQLGSIYVEILILFIADFEGSILTPKIADIKADAYRALCLLVRTAIQKASK